MRDGGERQIIMMAVPPLAKSAMDSEWRSDFKAQKAKQIHDMLCRAFGGRIELIRFTKEKRW